MTTLEYRRPTPLIFVNANMILSFPSTFVLSRRRMCWKAFLSGTTRAMVNVDTGSQTTVDFKEQSRRLFRVGSNPKNLGSESFLVLPSPCPRLIPTKYVTTFQE